MPHKQVAIQRSWQNEGSRPIMMFIAGDSAAGKTTLTKGLVAALGPSRATAMCVDDYHRFDRVERKAKPFTPLHPDCNYIEIMEQHLQLLAVGQPILKPVYNHEDGTLDRPVLIEPREFVIVEGLLPLHTKLARACADVTVYLDPPETIRHAWKVARDTKKRGYTEEQVREDLIRREPESEEFIRPQRAEADIVVQFSPIAERHERASDILSATLLLRPTIRHPDLSGLLGSGDSGPKDSGLEDSGPGRLGAHTREAAHVKLLRDSDGRPVDALHIHGYADPEVTEPLERAIWEELGTHEPFPDDLGTIEPGQQSAPLALTQLILMFHLVSAREDQPKAL